MKQKFSALLKEKLISRFILLYGMTLVLFVVITIWKWQFMPPELPLFYSLPRGEDQLVTPVTFLLIPFSSVFLFFFNYCLAAIFYSHSKLAAFLFILTGF